jgi:2-polyprenyl-6-methoxyphenol hydroxylase-like FAD-dependent oxidoreductase
MNTALIDAHNLSFKMNLVLRGLAGPDLLKTYNEERWKIGKQLIDFDEEYAALFSGEVPRHSPEVAKMSQAEVKQHFIAVQRRWERVWLSCFRSESILMPYSHFQPD